MAEAPGLPETIVRDGGVELAKQGLLGLAVVGLIYIVVVPWRDNLKLRKQLEEAQKTREERDDARFDEVTKLATQAAAALVQASTSSAAQSVALENTNKLIEKQGTLIEARTAVFQTIATLMLLVEAGLKALKDTLDGALRRFER